MARREIDFQIVEDQRLDGLVFLGGYRGSRVFRERGENLGGVVASAVVRPRTIVFFAQGVSSELIGRSVINRSAGRGLARAGGRRLGRAQVLEALVDDVDQGQRRLEVGAACQQVGERPAPGRNGDAQRGVSARRGRGRVFTGRGFRQVEQLLKILRRPDRRDGAWREAVGEPSL